MLRKFFIPCSLSGLMLDAENVSRERWLSGCCRNYAAICFERLLTPRLQRLLSTRVPVPRNSSIPWSMIFSKQVAH